MVNCKEVMIVYSVTKRVKMVKQPYGGYLNKRDFTIIQRNDGVTLNADENIHASLVGLVVDYMTRFTMGASKKDAFSISLQGAARLDLFTANKQQSATKNAVKLLKSIKGLDAGSIANACKLVGYDVCRRSSIMGYRPVEEIDPNSDTVENIITMINRSLSFWEEYGPISKDGFTFEGGYTDIISSGDGDYLTQDTLWDFKAAKAEPTSQHTLQILIYYIMGMHSIHKEFKAIKMLGIYNPRLNKVYMIDIKTIPQQVIDEVSTEVIGY